MGRTHLGGAVAALALGSSDPHGAGKADLLVVAVDNHSVNVNGAITAPKNPPPDLLAIVDVKSYTPKLVGTVVLWRCNPASSARRPRCGFRPMKAGRSSPRRPRSIPPDADQDRRR